MSRFFIFFFLAQLIVAMGGQPAWGIVLVHYPQAAWGTERSHWTFLAEESACCDPQVNDRSGEDKVMVAQIIDILTGVGKLIYNATDNSKEIEAAAKAAELQRQAEEKADSEEKNRILKARELDEQRRQNLSNPFAVSNDPYPIDRQLNESSKNKRPLIDIPQGAAGGAMVLSNQGGTTGTPANNGQNPMPGDSAMLAPPVGQAVVPVGQVAAPVGQQVVVPMEQVVVPMGQVVAPIGQMVVPVGQVVAPVGALPVPAISEGAVATPKQAANPGDAAAAQMNPAAVPVGQVVVPLNTVVTTAGNGAGQESMPVKNIVNENAAGSDKVVANSSSVPVEKASPPAGEKPVPAVKSDNPF